MKISLPKRFPGAPNVILPLVPVEEDSNLSKVDTCQFTLSSNPGTAGAATYKMTACILKGNESLRELICWRAMVDKVLNGLNLTTGPEQVPICEMTVADTPKALF